MKRLGLLLLVAMSCGSGRQDTIRWSRPVELATGGGERGPWQQNNSQYDFVDDPSVAIKPNGDAVVVWVDQARKDVFAQIVAADGTKRGPAVDVSRSPAEFSWLPRVALSPAAPGHVYVLWQEIIFSGGPHGGEIFFARSLDGGRTFEAPRNLTNSVAGEGKGRFDSKRWHNGSLDLTVADDGAIYMAWTDYEGKLTVQRSRDGGKTFDAPVVVATDRQRPARAPTIATGGGMVCLAWTVGEDDHGDLRVASSRDGTAFSAPAIIERSTGYSDGPKLARDRQGTWHLAYGETSGGPFDPAEVRYTRSRDCRTFDPPRTVSAAHGSGAGAAFPSLALDGDDVVVTWEYYPKAGGAPHGIGIAYSRDRGTTFTEPRLIAGTQDPGPNGNAEGRLTRKLAVRGDTIIVVNSARRPEESSRVWLVRGDRITPARSEG